MRVLLILLLMTSSAVAGEGLVPNPRGCPHVAFCGCGVSVWLFGHPVRSLYPASAYYQFPRTAPAAGAVAIWSHHVAGIIEYFGDGTALLYDPNSGGHRTRVHRRSIRHATIVNPRGATLSARRHRRKYRRK